MSYTVQIYVFPKDKEKLLALKKKMRKIAMADVVKDILEGLK